MKKTLSLWVDYQGWKSFEYETFDDIKLELNKRNIFIGHSATIGDSATIGNYAKIGHEVLVRGICFSGSKHHVAYWGEDAIQIGCKKFTIQEWLDNFKSIGEKEHYSEEQIQEYWNYIESIRILHKKGALLPISIKK